MCTENKHNLLLIAAGFITMVAAAIGLFTGSAQAADEPKTTASISDAKTTVDAADTPGSLREAIDAVAAAYTAYEKATDADKKEILWKAYTDTNDALVPKIIDGVRQSPDSPAAFELLEWVVTNGRISVRMLRTNGFQAIELLRAHFTADPNIRGICRTLGSSGDYLHQPTVEFLQIASTNNPDRAARGYATFALAQMTKRHSEEIAFARAEPPSIFTNAAVQKAMAAYLEKVKTQDPEGILHEAEQMFQAVKANYSDVPNFSSGPGLREPKATLGEQASIELYECQHLTLGKLAPEIQGEGIDGHKLRLSDYRGKVVVISFWASWCGPCMQMVPHECAMAQRLAGKPFVLVGVNGDSEKADAKRAMAEQKMTWQSFWNGKDTWGGIADSWNVHGWPTVYVLDSKGTIRFKLDGYGGKRTDALLDAEVDQLLEEAEGQGGAKI